MLKIAEKIYIFSCWIFFIFVLISLPLDNMGESEYFWGYDKLVHFFMFAILAVLTEMLIQEIFNYKKIKVTKFLFGLKYGLTLLFCLSIILTGEYLQKFIPGRFPSWGDVVFGVLGAIFSLLFIRIKGKSLSFFVF